MNRKQLFAILSLVVLAALVLSACGGNATTPAPTNAPEQPTTAPEQPTSVQEQPTAASEQPTTAPEVATPIALPDMDPSLVEGDIITAGSSTVFPLSEKMAEVFQQEGYSGNITVDSIGTGAGFERFCKTGETDISNASRPIKAEEVDACRAIGREPIGFRIATDGLAVVVNPQSPIANRGLTKEELGKIFGGEITTWNQLDASLPADKINIYSPGTDSGTFDYFVEVVLNKVKDGLLAIDGAQFSEDDNVLAQGVEGDKNAIGYFGYAYYEEAGSKLKALAINSVEPSQATVDDGSYPLSRPLFIYSDAKIMAGKPQVAAFIGFYVQHVNDYVSEVGYFPAPSNALNASVGEWLNVVAGN
jgi:phosphate binding protein